MALSILWSNGAYCRHYSNSLLNTTGKNKRIVETTLNATWYSSWFCVRIYATERKLHFVSTIYSPIPSLSMYHQISFISGYIFPKSSSKYLLKSIDDTILARNQRSYVKLMKQIQIREDFHKNSIEKTLQSISISTSATSVTFTVQLTLCSIQ
jgi:hypothetical protein